MLAQIDKTVLALLVSAIKADLHLSDTQMGLVVGFAFAVANFSITLPAGWLADRTSRRRLIAAGVAFWSVMATLCGAASGFLQLFVARMGVGLGEGVIPPPAYSLIRDGMPPQSHGRAFGVYGMAASCGAGLSLILGGFLLGVIHAQGWNTLPVLGEVSPWQLCLIIIGLGGLPLAALAYAFRDPGRGAETTTAATTFRSALQLMSDRRGVVVPLLAFSVLHAMIAASLAVWAPTMLARSFGLGPAEIGYSLGLVLLVVAPLGLSLAGGMMDRLSARRRNAPAWVAVGAAILLGAAATLTPQSPTLWAFWALQSIVVASSTVYLPVTSTVVAKLFPGSSTGKVMAIFLVAQGVCGAGLAPVVTGWVSDTFFPGNNDGLSNALSAVGLVYGLAGLIAALFMVRGLGTSNERG